jgi:hypothetical protein
MDPYLCPHDIDPIGDLGLSPGSKLDADKASNTDAGTPVGTAITEATANFLVNCRINQAQQIRGSRQGANLLLRVRCAVYNGRFGSGCGQKFCPANVTHPHPRTIAA